jgi:hypothetical protein
LESGNGGLFIMLPFEAVTPGIDGCRASTAASARWLTRAATHAARVARLKRRRLSVPTTRTAITEKNQRERCHDRRLAICATRRRRMFVQSAHFIERLKKDPTKLATFYGMEKNPTTIRLAKMNLAVYGLEGKIDKAITYYDDPHELVGKADFVMATSNFCGHSSSQTFLAVSRIALISA